MKKTAKQRQNELRKKRYRIIVNLYGSSKLASQLSGWSNEHIYKIYGIDINKTKSIPKIREQSKRLKKEKQQTLQTFFELRKSYGVHEAFKYRKEPKKLIAKEKKRPDYLPPSDEQLLQQRSKRYDYQTRKGEWSAWSKHSKGHPEEKFPDLILRMIQRLNLERGLELDSSYGYAIIHKVYVLGYSFKEAYDFIEVKPGSFKGYQYKSEELF